MHMARICCDSIEDEIEFLREHAMPYWTGIFKYGTDDCHVEAQSVRLANTRTPDDL